MAGALRQFFVRPRAVLELAVLGALISAAIIIITAVGGAKLLAVEGSEALPVVYVLLAVVSIPLASAISAALGRWSTPLICRVMCVVSLVAGVVLRAAVASPLPAVPQAICITAYALEIVFDTLFWLSVSEYLPTRDLKRHTPFLAAAFGLGGVVGGLLATALCEIVPAEDLLFLEALLFALCFVQYQRMSRLLKPLGDGSDEDEEETGLLESLRSTLHVFRAFPITGSISAGIFLMSALFCLQDYLAMTLFSEVYSDEDALASFIAMAYAGYQVAELLMVVAIGSLVLERAGPVVRNLIFPLTTLVSLFTLSFAWTLPAGLLLHLNANAVSNAVFEPVKTLNYAAVPFRVLAPVRMMVEGIVYPFGIAVSGLALLWLQSSMGSRSVLLITLGVAVAFVAMSILIGRSFLPSLITSLRVRAILPADYLDGEGERLFSRADIRQLLVHASPEARRFGRDLARALAPDLLHQAHMPPSRSVDLAPSASPRPGPVHRWLQEGPLQPSSNPRAATALTDAPPQAHPPAGASSSEASAPLSASPKQATTSDMARQESAAGRSASAQIAIAEGRLGLGSRRPRIIGRRRTIGRVLWRSLPIWRSPRPSAARRLERLARRLEAKDGRTRRRSARALGAVGSAAVDVATRRLASPRPEVAEAAIQALGTIGTARAKRKLRSHLQPLYRRAQLNHEALLALQELTGSEDRPSTAQRAIETWLTDSNRSILRRVLVVSSALGNRRDVNLLRWLARTAEPRVRSNAVEALTSLPTGDFIRPLLPLFDAEVDRQSDEAARQGPAKARANPFPVLHKLASEDPWVRMLVHRLLGNPARTPARSHDPSPMGDEIMLDRILFLKSAPLLKELPLEDVARLARAARSVSYEPREMIIRAQDLITNIVILEDGIIELCVDEAVVETLHPGSSFGEAALFGRRRSATSVRAAAAARILSLPLSIVGDLIAENPDVLAPIAADLARRIGALHVELAEHRHPTVRESPLQEPSAA